ncbi:hypothetical protein ERJ75_000459900 [Trypanosoma vivax]|uniref:Uncharacterized protein n=1 Tax=Trypanosoma vivax (strain Y486) TaxID=1055687 RepID=G0U536_TRYVY|nr:hypothetical protein ERJ75_000459900 [Trypanosoma vivax]CCC50984.1 conserved hypothetical protein [Trypanosoma vivax Y486]
MDESIVQIPLYTATSAWRQETQLRGLLRNHPSIVARSCALLPDVTKTVHSAALLAPHRSKSVLAVGLNPLSAAGGSVGLIAVEDGEKRLDGVKNMQWLDMPNSECLSSIEWCDQLLLAGSSRGRVFTSTIDPTALAPGRQTLEPGSCLLASDNQTPLGDIVIPPSNHAVSTVVRSLQCNAGVSMSMVVGVVDSSAKVWDVGGDSQPVYTWSPKPDTSAGQQDILLFARWAPGSDSVVLTGSYNGGLILTDTRVDSCAPPSLALPMRRGWIARCADFNTLLPCVVAAASSDGTISVFDCRYPTTAVRAIPSQQGDVMSIKFLKFHPDILASGGVDGTVALWNLRVAPTYCVGRSQFQHPVFDLATTKWFLDQNVFGVTCGGELMLTGLSQSALAAMAPFATDGVIQEIGQERKTVSASLEVEGDQLLQRERHGVGLLFTRRLREAYKVIVECATERFRRNEIAVSLKLVDTLNIMTEKRFDFKALVGCSKPLEQRGREGAMELVPNSCIIQAFDDLLMQASQRLSCTFFSDNSCEREAPDPGDVAKLEALQLNLHLLDSLTSGSVEMVIEKLKRFIAHGGDVSLIDTDTACRIVRVLLKDRNMEGQKLVHTLLSSLVQPDGAAAAHTLVRRLLIVVQEPLVTDGMPRGRAQRHEEQFLSNLESALKAVEVQLEIQGLGIENYGQVISTVNKYQSQCLKNGESGIFGWLALKPLLLFVHCLTADSNYATFFWACVQLIEVLPSYTGKQEVEVVLFSTVNSIKNCAKNLRDQLQERAEVSRFTPSMLRNTSKLLSSAHEFLVLLLRVQLDCENVAMEGKMQSTPPVMVRILDILSTASSDVLTAWAEVLNVLMRCPLRNLVRSSCRDIVRAFALEVESLVQVSAKKEEDEILNDILETCDEFFESMMEDSL